MGGRGALERRRHEQGERVTGPSYIISATGGGGGEGERGGDQQPTRMAITAVHLRLGNSLREEGAPGPPLLRQSESKAMPVFEVRDFPRGGVGRVHDDTGLVFSVSRNAAGQDCLEVVSSQDGAGWRMQACDGGGVASRRSQSGCASLASCTEAKSSELSAADTWCARSGRRRSTGTPSTGVASCPRLSSTGSLPPISSEGAVIETRGIRHPAAVGARAASWALFDTTFQRQPEDERGGRYWLKQGTMLVDRIKLADGQPGEGRKSVCSFEGQRTRSL